MTNAQKHHLEAVIIDPFATEEDVVDVIVHSELQNLDPELIRELPEDIVRTLGCISYLSHQASDGQAEFLFAAVLADSSSS